MVELQGEVTSEESALSGEGTRNAYMELFGEEGNRRRRRWETTRRGEGGEGMASSAGAGGGGGEDAMRAGKAEGGGGGGGGMEVDRKRSKAESGRKEGETTRSVIQVKFRSASAARKRKVAEKKEEEAAQKRKRVGEGKRKVEEDAQHHSETSATGKSGQPELEMLPPVEVGTWSGLESGSMITTSQLQSLGPRNIPKLLGEEQPLRRTRLAAPSPLEHFSTSRPHRTLSYQHSIAKLEAQKAVESGRQSDISDTSEALPGSAALMLPSAPVPLPSIESLRGRPRLEKWEPLASRTLPPVSGPMSSRVPLLSTLEKQRRSRVPVQDDAMLMPNPMVRLDLSRGPFTAPNRHDQLPGIGNAAALPAPKELLSRARRQDWSQPPTITELRTRPPSSLPSLLAHIPEDEARNRRSEKLPWPMAPSSLSPGMTPLLREGAGANRSPAFPPISALSTPDNTPRSLANTSNTGSWNRSSQLFTLSTTQCRN